MTTILILLSGVILWFIGFKTFKEKTFERAISASFLSLIVVTLGFTRFRLNTYNDMDKG